MSQPKPTPPSPTPGKRKIFDCSSAPKVFSLCDLCSCWWNCMIFSEAALAPEPLVSDIITEPKNHKEIVEQPTTSSLLSTALVPIHDKRWQFDGGRIKSNFGFLPTLRSNMTKEESRRIMEMKEERHRLKMEILQLEKEAVQNKIQNSNDDCHVKLIEEEISVLA